VGCDGGTPLQNPISAAAVDLRVELASDRIDEYSLV
jgi:hypothetical protein